MTPPMINDMPPAEVEVSDDLVRSLLVDQHPDLADLPLSEFANGWDNLMFRLGSELVVRLPRREMAAPLIEHEQRWLPELAPRLPLAVPAPVRVGRPTVDYPWSWSILAWLAGTTVGNDGWDRPDEAAEAVGRFLAALHTPAPDRAPTNPHRGGPLRPRDEMTRNRIEQLAGRIDADGARSAWQESVMAPPWDGPPIWLHGDLHPFNLLQDEGRPSAVIDFGDICGGDPACDLAIAFSAFDPTGRTVLRAAADSRDRPIDDATWLRARGWCLSVGTSILAFSADNPSHEIMGRRMIEAAIGR